MKKKIKDGSLYFHQKDILRPIGTVLLPVGLVCLYLGWNFSYLAYIVATITIPVGFVFFMVGGAKIISDSDIVEQMEHAMVDYDKSVTDMVGYDRIVLKQPAPVEISAYHFGDKAKYFKKGKNGTPISDRYTRSHVFFTKESVMIVSRTISIAELNEAEGIGISDLSEHIAFTSIRSASLMEYDTTVTLTNTGKPLTVKWCELVLQGEEGEILRIPTKNDMDASSLVDDINRRCGR